MAVPQNFVVRRAGPHHLPELGRLVDEVMRPYATPGEGMARRFPLLYRADNANNLYFISDMDDRPISMAPVWRGAVVTGGVRVPMAAIGSVATKAEHRGHKLASRILQRIWEELVAERVAVALISGRRSLYHRLGAVEAGDFIMAEVPAERSNLELWNGMVERVSPHCGMDVIGSLAAVYHAEGVRYSRTVREMGELLEGLAYPRRNTQHDLYIAKRGERIMAYVIAGVSDRWRGSRVMEWAGARQAVVALAQQAAVEYQTPSTHLMFRSQDWSMRDYVEEAGWSMTKCLNLGTMAIVDWRSFHAAISPWLDETQVHEKKRMKATELTRGRYSSDGALTQWVFSEEGLHFPWPYAGELNYV